MFPQIPDVDNNKLPSGVPSAPEDELEAVFEIIKNHRPKPLVEMPSYTEIELLDYCKERYKLSNIFYPRLFKKEN